MFVWFLISLAEYLSSLTFLWHSSPLCVCVCVYVVSECFLNFDGNVDINSLSVVVLVMFMCFFVFSGSACSTSAGLESMGLADVRLLVKLMCLVAAGRVSTDSKHLGQFMPVVPLSDSPSGQSCTTLHFIAMHCSNSNVGCDAL